MEEKLSYPKSVLFIVFNAFCERFCYYGIRAILVLYLKNVLEFSPDKATVYYHAFSGLSSFTCLFGAIIADSFLGKFRTIVYLSIVYVIGSVTLSSSAATGWFTSGKELFSLLGLLFIAIGTGGIKPCVSAFGGDQFKRPQQALQLSSFFSVFYVSTNVGSLLSTALSPSLRKDVSCFGANTCYSLAFSVPAALIIVGLVVFVVGKPWYTQRPFEGNIVAKVIRCVTHAVVRREEPKRNHWLDKADDKFDKQLIDDIKVFFKILVLFVPIPLYHALAEQQGSRWTFQATRMDGEVFGYQIKPDQFQIINPVLIIILVPIFNKFVYPFFNKMGVLTTPLQKMTVGGLLTAVAFVISAMLQLKLEPTYEVTLETNQSHLNFINTLPCNVNINFDDKLNHTLLNSLENKLFTKIAAGSYKVSITSSDPLCGNYSNHEEVLEASSLTAQTFSIVVNNDKLRIEKDATTDELMKSKEGDSKLKVIQFGLEEYVKFNATLALRRSGIPENAKQINLGTFASKWFEIEPHDYQLHLEFPYGLEPNISISESILPRLGGNYILTLTRRPGMSTPVSNLYTLTEPNSVHMVWMFPQCFVIAVAEILISISGLEFSYSQAPTSMKSVVSAAWLLTKAFGNLIVIIVLQFIKCSSQSYEFLLFAGLMVGDMAIFSIMAYFYKPTEKCKRKESTPAEFPLMPKVSQSSTPSTKE